MKGVLGFKEKVYIDLPASMRFRDIAIFVLMAQFRELNERTSRTRSWWRLLDHQGRQRNVNTPIYGSKPFYEHFASSCDHFVISMVAACRVRFPV